MNYILNLSKMDSEGYLGEFLEYDIVKFPGGEVSVTIKLDEVEVGDDVTILSSFKSSDDLFKLAMAVDAIRRWVDDVNITVVLPYIPGARHDKALTGEPLGAKVYAIFLNSLPVNNYVVLDPHSDVSPGLLNNLVIIDNKDLIAYAKTEIKGHPVLAAPDAGAAKKLARLGESSILCGKVRDMVTGKLSGFRVYDDVAGKDVMVVDDICDGGGTFIGLGKELMKAGAKKLYLVVTHGIFSKGLDSLLQYYDTIITTDSIDNGLEHERLIKIPVYKCR